MSCNLLFTLPSIPSVQQERPFPSMWERNHMGNVIIKKGRCLACVHQGPQPGPARSQDSLPPRCGNSCLSFFFCSHLSMIMVAGKVGEAYGSPPASMWGSFSEVALGSAKAWHGLSVPCIFLSPFHLLIKSSLVLMITVSPVNCKRLQKMRGTGLQMIFKIYRISLILLERSGPYSGRAEKRKDP